MKHVHRYWVSLRLLLAAFLVKRGESRFLPIHVDMILPLRTRQVGNVVARQTFLSNANSLLRQRYTQQSLKATTHVLFKHGSQRYQRILVRRQLLDFFDPLEPIELLWELYVNRYEILDELVAKVSSFARRNSVRAGVYFGGALVAAELLSRVGALRGSNSSSSGRQKQSLVQHLRQSRRVQEGLEERLYQKTSSFLLNHAILLFSNFRHLSKKSKFAVAVSAGAVFGQVVIQLTVLSVKTVLISFFVLETASFLGVIGEPGESLLDWVDDQVESKAAWTDKALRWHKSARQCMNLDVLESLYEACVDEEKIASFGFSVGTVFALLT